MDDPMFRDIASRFQALDNRLVEINAGLDGRPDEGFEYFKKAFELPGFGGGMFRFAPTWEDARQDPRVMERINERRRAARLSPLR